MALYTNKKPGLQS